MSIVFLLGVIALGVVLYPTFKGSDNIKIPDVTNLSVEQAEKALTNIGFNVANETIKEYSETIPEGKVIGTDPAIGRSRPKGTTITICESLGKNDTYIIENYVGKNYIEVQTTLEKLYKMDVEIEKRSIEITEDMDLQLIIDQSLEVGTEITISEENPTKIILYIPDAYDQYPDFVAEGWTVDEVEEFAKKYSLKFDIDYVESTEYPDGTIIKQSRTGKIVNGASLTITVTRVPDEISTEDPSVDDTDKTEDTSGNQ